MCASARRDRFSSKITVVTLSVVNIWLRASDPVNIMRAAIVLSLIGYARQRTERALGNQHNSSVQTRADKYPSLLLWIMTASVMLLSTAGFAALIAWMPFLIGVSRDALPVSSIDSAKPVAAIDAATIPEEGLARRKVRCRECGLIESIRETQGHGKAISLIAAGRPVAENQNRISGRSASREITVRLEDGSSHVMTDANPAGWRLGERVLVIGSVD
jgi:hypothetical protein